MTLADYQSSKEIGPKIGSIAAIDFTTSSASVSLATELGDGKPWDGQMLTLISTVAVYFAFGDADDAIDEAEVTPGHAERAFLLPANLPLRVFPNGTHIITKGAGAGILRLYVSSP